MHYIVETEFQLERLYDGSEYCFINIVPLNENTHPQLTSPSLVYFRSANSKGYILSINHSEGFSLDFNKVKEVLSKYKQIYCLDAKYHSYFVDLPLIDINYYLIDQGEKPRENKADAPLINNFYHRCYPYCREVNRIIPISKIYEYWEQEFNKIPSSYFKEYTTDFYKRYTQVYKQVEDRGLKIDTRCFSDFFSPHTLSDSYQDGVVYSKYNLYNTTCRPTNAFNGINFLALNKENHSRKCYVPFNDYFVELDFDGYHVRLIAKLIGFELPADISIHTYFGKQYFKEDVLTPEQYQASKSITFQNIYGGIKDEWLHIPFYKALSIYLDDLWDTYQYSGYIVLPTGRTLKVEKDMNPLKLFNYTIQNLETKTNVEFLTDLLPMFEGKQSFINLVVYDSFLIDFSMSDGKELLTQITNYLNQKGFIVKVKYGKNYDSLQKTNYL